MNLNFEGYEIIEELGFGGMATVYKAKQLKLDRMVVIKTMKPALYQDESFRERFVREAKISAKLSHPNIVQIYDVVVQESGSYLSIEYIDNGDLGDRLAQPIDMENVFHLVNQISSALDYAHNKNVIHRDVKTKNILVRSNGSFVLADFGIAKAMDMGTQMTMDGSIVGSPKYMSPEQAKGNPVDSRADFYGFGIVLFEVLTGNVPFDGDSSVAVALKHLNEPIPLLEGELQAFNPFFKKILAKEVKDRYSNGAEVVEGFYDCLKNINEQTIIYNIPDKNSFSPSYLNSSNNSSFGSQNNSSFGSQQILNSVSKIITPNKFKNRKLIILSFLVVIISIWLIATYNQNDNKQEIKQHLSTAYKLLQENQLAKSLVQFKKVLELDNSNGMAQESIKLTKEMLIKDLKTEVLSENYAHVENKISLLESKFDDDEEIQAIKLELQKSRTLKNLRQSNLEKYSQSEILFNSTYANKQYLLPLESNASKHLADMIVLQPNNLKIKSVLETLENDILLKVRKKITATDLNSASKLIPLFEKRYGSSKELLEIKNLLSEQYQSLAKIESNNKLKQQIIRNFESELNLLGKNLNTLALTSNFYDRYQHYIKSGGTAKEYLDVAKSALTNLNKYIDSQPLESINFKGFSTLLTYDAVIEKLKSSTELVNFSSLLNRKKQEFKSANTLLKQLSEINVERINKVDDVKAYYFQLKKLLPLNFYQSLMNQKKIDFVLQMEVLIKNSINNNDMALASQLLSFFKQEDITTDISNWQTMLDRRMQELNTQKAQRKLKESNALKKRISRLISDGKGLLPHNKSALSALKSAKADNTLDPQTITSFVEQIYQSAFENLNALKTKNQYDDYLSFYNDVLAGFDILAPEAGVKRDIIAQKNAYQLRHEERLLIQTTKDNLYAELSTQIQQQNVEHSLDTIDKIRSYKQANIPKAEITRRENRVMLLLMNTIDKHIEKKEKKEAQRLVNRALDSFINNEELLIKQKRIENIKNKEIKLIGF